MVTIDYEAIAGRVLKLAADFDQRMIPTSQAAHDSRRMSWAILFTGHVWPSEAEDAVVHHYQGNRAFALMPGDVVDYCAKKLPWSSPEHARDWILRTAVQNPYAHMLEEFSGIPEPVIEIPNSVTRAGERVYLTEQLHQWAVEHMPELVTAILAKRFVPAWWAK